MGVSIPPLLRLLTAVDGHLGAIRTRLRRPELNTYDRAAKGRLPWAAPFHFDVDPGCT